MVQRWRWYDYLHLFFLNDRKWNTSPHQHFFPNTGFIIFTSHKKSICQQPSVNVPDVPTKYISDGCADKVSLASDGSLVSGANLLPLILTAFFLLISNIFLHTWLGLWPVGRGSFCSTNMKEKNTFEVKWPKNVKWPWSKMNSSPESIISLGCSTSTDPMMLEGCELFIKAEIWVWTCGEMNIYFSLRRSPLLRNLGLSDDAYTVQ